MVAVSREEARGDPHPADPPVAPRADLPADPPVALLAGLPVVTLPTATRTDPTPTTRIRRTDANSHVRRVLAVVTETSASVGSKVLTTAKRTWNRTRDRRYTRLQSWAFVLTLALLVFAVARIPGNDWGQRFAHARYHLWVVGWFLLLTYKWRTVGSREIVRFWTMGFFPVALVTYLLTEPLERLVGTGNIQTAVWVPIVEEVVKMVPLLLWATLMKPKHRQGTLSDFWILGFAIGAGFSFHEDALYNRLVASGFGDGLTGTLFPIFLTGSQFVVTHAGWAALAGVGVGVFVVYRSRPWAWPVGAVLLAAVILDHSAVNWRGGGAELMRSVMADGRVASGLLVLSVVLVVGHDWYMARWANKRDNLFPDPWIRGDLLALGSGPIETRLGTLFARQRYRRFRNAAFSDLCAVRLRGDSAGDRSEVIRQLEALEAASGGE